MQVTIIGIILSGLLVAAALAQEPPAGPPQVSSLRGFVTGSGGTSVRDVAVVLFPASEEAWTAGSSGAIQCVLPADGVFTLAAAPPGEYLLTVAPSSIVGDCANPERLRRMRQGAPSFTFPPAGTTVVLRLTVESDAAPRIVSMTISTSMITVEGPPEPGAVMPPGAPRPPAMPAPGRGGRPAVPLPGAISGRLTGPTGRPLAGVPVQAARRQSLSPDQRLLPFGRAVTLADGSYLIPNVPDGEILVIALPVREGDSPLEASAPAVPAVTGEDGRRSGPLLTYYPGVASAAAARPINVSGREVMDVDFVMRHGAVSTLSIAVSDIDPNLAGTSVATLLPQPFVDQIGGRNVRRGMVMPDGRLTLADVPAGPHVLTVNGPGGWARRDLNVDGDGRPVEIRVPLEPHLTVSGSVELKASRVRITSEVLSQIQVELQPVPRASGSPLLRAQVSEAGTFSIPRVPGNRYILTVVPPTFWTPISGTIGRRDTLDFAVDLSTSPSDAVLVLADQETTVHGRVRAADRSETAGVRVVVFADDSAYWRPGSRRVRVLSAGPAGAFSVSGLPPGAYRAAAFPAGTPINNARLAAVRGQATSFTLAIGESVVVDVTVER